MGILTNPPHRIDRYRVVRELGRGAFGIVYLAVHEVIGREVALKVLQPQHASSIGALRRFLGEAQAIAAVRSPHIAQVFDAGITPDGSAFIAMELLVGEDLAHHLRAHAPLGVEAAVDIARQILVALAAAHRASVVHRDLKPANVFLLRDASGRGQVKVLDFGISKFVHPEREALTMTGAMLGTPQYMAPEQLENARDVDGRADLYAVGSVLYEMLTHELPFDTSSLAGLVAAKLTDTPRPLGPRAPHLPPALVAVVERALSRQPDARFQTAEEMDRALALAIAPAPKPARGPGSTNRAAPPASRGAAPGSRRVAWALFALGSALVVGLLVVGLLVGVSLDAARSLRREPVVVAPLPPEPLAPRAPEATRSTPAPTVRPEANLEASEPSMTPMEPAPVEVPERRPRHAVDREARDDATDDATHDATHDATTHGEPHDEATGASSATLEIANSTLDAASSEALSRGALAGIRRCALPATYRATYQLVRFTVGGGRVRWIRGAPASGRDTADSRCALRAIQSSLDRLPGGSGVAQLEVTAR